MRVILYPDLEEERRSSMERYGVELAQALQARRLHVRLCIPPRCASASKVENYYARFVRYPWVAAKQQGDVHHVMDHGYAHIVHALDPRRTVVTCHDLVLLRIARGEIPCRHRPRMATWMFRFSVRGMKRAARIVADSWHTKRDIVALLGYPEERVAVVPLGVSSRFQRVTDRVRLETVRRRYGIPGEPFHVLHVGSSAAYKNGEAVLRVVARLRRSDAGVRLLRIGKLSPELVRLARRLGIAGAIVELADVPDEDMAALYSLAGCLLFPSFSEGFGLPPLEGMACGLPVIVSRGGALPEVVGDAGLYVDPGDVEGMARAVRSLREPRYAASLVEGGLRRARHFSWAETARATAAIYEEVAREGRSAGVAA